MSAPPVDLTRQVCPGHLLQACHALAGATAGERLEFRLRDARQASELAGVLRQGGHRVVGAGRTKDYCWLEVVKGG